MDKNRGEAKNGATLVALRGRRFRPGLHCAQLQHDRLAFRPGFLNTGTIHLFKSTPPAAHVAPRMHATSPMSSTRSARRDMPAARKRRQMDVQPDCGQRRNQMNCGRQPKRNHLARGHRCRLLGCWRDPAVEHCRFKRCLRAGGERYRPAPRSSPAESAPRQSPLKAEKAGTWPGLFSAPPVPLHPWSRLKRLLAVGL